MFESKRLLHTHDRIRSKTFSRNDSLLLEQLHKRIKTPEEEPARKHVNDGKHASKIQKRYTLHGTFGRKSSSKLPKSVGSKDYAKSNQYLSDLHCGSSSALHDPSFCNGNIQNKQTSSLGNLNRIFRMSKDANNEENNKIVSTRFLIEVFVKYTFFVCLSSSMTFKKTSSNRFKVV